MLRRIDKVYQKQVAQYVQLVLHFGSLSLFDIALAVHKRIDDILLSYPDISIIDIYNHCEYTGTRIATTCKGLLEVHELTGFHEYHRRVTATNSYISRRGKFFFMALEDRNIPLKRRDEVIKIKFSQCTRVHFLHRTALEFFRDTNGRILCSAKSQFYHLSNSTYGGKYRSCASGPYEPTGSQRSNDIPAI